MRNPKNILKKSAKTFLLASKKVASKNRTLKRAGQGVRNVLFPIIKPTLYNYARYAPSIAEYLKQRDTEGDFKIRPLISIVMPTYNTSPRYLEECIESVLVQSYSNWELCIADDASPNKNVVETLERFRKQDQRIKLVKRKKNGHISAATNSAIEVADGEFIALLDHDDVLSPNALFEVVKRINENPDTDFIYTDEDKIDDDNLHTYPFFKPDWSPEFLESCNYITHFSVIRKTIIDRVEGLRIGYEGAQDWDLFLRVTRETDAIEHIPKILYSWRIHDESTAKNTDTKPYVYEAQRKLLEDHIVRTNKEGAVNTGIITQHSYIKYQPKGVPLVSIIVAINSDNNRQGLKDLLRNNTYKNFEIIAVSSQNDTEKILGRKLANNKHIKIIELSKDSTLADKYNAGTKISKGEYIIFVQSELVVTTNSWIEQMLGDIQNEGVGVVGGKIVNESEALFLRAGGATGIFSLYAPLLEGMPVTDIHYMRGLYGQSRRNVSVLDGYFMVSKQNYDLIGGFDENLDNLLYADFCLKLLEKNLRNVYNPFIQAKDTLNTTAADLHKMRGEAAKTRFKKRWHKYIKDDPYLNPNFSKSNAQMDFKYG